MTMSEERLFRGQASTLTEPRLEFVMEVRLWFARVQTIANMPTGASRGAVYVDRGEFAGPQLRGKVVPSSGGDYALFRPDGTVSFDACYMLQEEDGTLILLRNRGFLWGRQVDTMQRLRAMIFDGGPTVDSSEYYLRAAPSFEVEAGKHDWLTRHVFVGIGERKPDGNLIRYYVLL
jgi:Protein of unknown function (DUF3237)